MQNYVPTTNYVPSQHIAAGQNFTLLKFGHFFLNYFNFKYKCFRAEKQIYALLKTSAKSILHPLKCKAKNHIFVQHHLL